MHDKNNAERSGWSVLYCFYHALSNHLLFKPKFRPQISGRIRQVQLYRLISLILGYIIVFYFLRNKVQLT